MDSVSGAPLYSVVLPMSGSGRSEQSATPAQPYAARPTRSAEYIPAYPDDTDLQQYSNRQQQAGGNEQMQAFLLNSSEDSDYSKGRYVNTYA